MAITNGETLITSLTTLDDVYSVALKIARTIIENARVSTKFADFDKSEIEFGAIIEKLKVQNVVPTTFDPNETDFASAAYPTILKRYFGDWTSKRFDTEVQQARAKSVVMDAGKLSEFVAAIVNNLTISEKFDAEDGYKAFFFNNGTSNTVKCMIGVKSNDASAAAFSNVTKYGFLYTLGQYEIMSLPTIDDTLEELRNIVDDFQNNNGTYSNSFKTFTPVEDIRIIANYKWLNKIDVEKLAHVFNMEKADLMAKIIKTDALEFSTAHASATSGQNQSTHGYGVIVCDVNGLGRVVKGRETETAFVKERFSQWYGTHFDDMYMFDPYTKAYALLFTDVETKKA